MATTAKMLGKKQEAAEEQVEAPAVEETAAEKAAEAAAVDGKAVKGKDFIKETAQFCEKLTKQKAIQVAKKLLDEIDGMWFRFGGAMSVVQANDYWKDQVDTSGEKYQSFKSFIEAEYGMPYRKGMYYIQIYNDLVDSGIEWHQIEPIGWTKLKEISGILTVENVDEWRERSLSMTTLQLIDYVRELQKSEADGSKSGPGPDADKKATTLTFKVYPDQKTTIQQAVDKSLKENKTDAPAVALEYICMSYLEGKLGKSKVKEKPWQEIVKDVELEALMTLIGELHPEYDITVVEK